MKIFKIILYSFLSLLLIIILAAFIIVKRLNREALPDYEGEIHLQGLQKEVKVITDRRGMPHIYAGSEQDLYLAVGYIMARERLWQMDLIRRATTGELSEIFGEDYVETDLFLRALRMTEKSKKVLGHNEGEILESIELFTKGVNSYIEQAGNKLPPEFKILGYKPDDWTPENSANIIGYMGWDLAGGNLSGDIFIYRLAEELGWEAATAMIPYYDYTGDPVYPGFKLDDKSLVALADFIDAGDKIQDLGIVPFQGSNNWAVSGGRTGTGKPVLSNDMHLGLSSPGIWMQMHQVVPGRLNVTGVAIPGEPYIVAGHNENIAWGMTNLMVDDVDLFLEMTDENKTKYLFDGEWKDIIIEKELIRVKKGKTMEREIKYTHHGPIISALHNIEGDDISMCWSGYDMSNELQAVYLLNRAEDWHDFDKALSFFNSISQNFIYADVNGNIGLKSGGGVPIRKGHGALIRRGDSSRYDWKGYVPHDELPYSYNPENGSVSSANNKTVLPDDYPYYIGTYFSMPYRINRIRDMLSEKDIFELDDFRRMITDRHSDYAGQLCPLLLDALQRTEEMDDLEREVYDHLSVWDYSMSPDSFTPTFFEYYRKILADRLLGDDMGGIYDNFNGSVRDYYILKILTGQEADYIDDINTKERETLEDILLAAYRQTVKLLKDKYTTDTSRWIWGDLHRFTAMHPLGSLSPLDRLFGLNEGPYRVGGSNHTVSPYSYSNENFEITNGASQRHIYNTADWDESYTIIPTGNSGLPSSEFYCSQTETYTSDGFYKDPFSREAVEGAAMATLVLKPVESKKKLNH